jgi:hypothetical protein
MNGKYLLLALDPTENQFEIPRFFIVVFNTKCELISETFSCGNWIVKDSRRR